jgi:hypothetical protein
VPDCSRNRAAIVNQTARKLVGVAGFEPATPSSRTRRAALGGRRRGGQSGIVCYHFATQLANTEWDYNERGDCRAIESPYTFWEERALPDTRRQRPDQTLKPVVWDSSPSY